MITQRKIYSKGLTMSEERIPRNEILEERRRFIRTRMLLTISEAATMLAVSPRTVKGLIDEGRLPRINEHKHAGRTRVTAESIDRYIQSMLDSPETD
jgi:excisionase family DNA binding protein